MLSVREYDNNRKFQNILHVVESQLSLKFTICIYFLRVSDQNRRDSSSQPRDSPPGGPPDKNSSERWPLDERFDYQERPLPHPGASDRFPPHPDHREFPFDDRGHGEYPPRDEFFERRGHENFHPRPPHHPDFNNRGYPPPNEVRRPHPSRPPLLPFPPRRPEFDERGPPRPPLPPIHKPEIKTVPAEKIFDLPGRNERPSHVRYSEREREGERGREREGERERERETERDRERERGGEELFVR